LLLPPALVRKLNQVTGQTPTPLKLLAAVVVVLVLRLMQEILVLEGVAVNTVK
jgi:hypothetical protein